MKESYYTEIEMPKLSLKQRDLFTSLLLRLASPLSFQGLEDWTIDLAASKKILGAAEEFHDLTKSSRVSRVIRAHFWKKEDANTLVGLLGKLFDGLKASKPKKLGQKDWMKEWRKHYKIQWIEEAGVKLAIVPAWIKVPKGALAVRIHPGQAFGTGTHATTRLCLKAYLKVASQNPPPKVLDFGAGTGILLIAAEKYAKAQKQKFSGLAVESDPQALEQCRKNARVNKSKIHFSLKMKKKKYDFVFANVLAPVLIDHQKKLCAAVAPDGHLVLSGLLKKELKSFLQKFLAKGFSLEEKMIEGDWAALVFKKTIF